MSRGPPQDCVTGADVCINVRADKVRDLFQELESVLENRLDPRQLDDRKQTAKRIAHDIWQIDPRLDHIARMELRTRDFWASRLGSEVTSENCERKMICNLVVDEFVMFLSRMPNGWEESQPTPPSWSEDYDLANNKSTGSLQDQSTPSSQLDESNGQDE